MPFPVVLPRECLSTYRADKRSFVSMSSEMGSEVVSSCKSFRTETALECRGVFLHSFRISGTGPRSLWIGKVKDVVAVWDGGCGRAAANLG